MSEPISGKRHARCVLVCALCMLSVSWLRAAHRSGRRLQVLVDHGIRCNGKAIRQVRIFQENPFKMGRCKLVGQGWMLGEGERTGVQETKTERPSRCPGRQSLMFRIRNDPNGRPLKSPANESGECSNGAGLAHSRFSDSSPSQKHSLGTACCNT